jgi:hypothetical protein
MQFLQEQTYIGWSGMVTWPQRAHKNQAPSARANIALKLPASTQYGHRAALLISTMLELFWLCPARIGAVAYFGACQRLLFAVVISPILISEAGSLVERWQQLYEEAAKEKDPNKLSELVYEIHCLLREKEGRPLPPPEKAQDEV